ncbi:Hypothetical protein NGAL_HAMBI2610_41910 [Neorhizobium galegae bv. orientalis]|nr:Hypothetical protein NGAL_HAMBI2610_41910 [Neorhizobium galegae bv. orientalis]
MYASMVAAQPWIAFTRKALEVKNWRLPPDESVQIGSDYAGQHSKGLYLTYAFVVSSKHNWAWDRQRWYFRQNHIPDNRRISFKSFGKSNNPLALAHFLDITQSINGRLIVFAFEKKLILQIQPIRPADGSFKLDANWKPLALEEAVRKAMIVALLANQYVPPGLSMDWISDEDPSLGNSLMFSDVQRITATLCATLSSVKRGFFGMGTTADDCEHMYREDLLAIADFAAGMVAEVATHLDSRRFLGPDSIPRKNADFEMVSEKAQIIAEWFWQAKSPFDRTCFLIHGTCERPHFTELQM